MVTRLDRRYIRSKEARKPKEKLTVVKCGDAFGILNFTGRAFLSDDVVQTKRYTDVRI